MDAETIHNRRWSILLVLCLSLIMIILGNTVLNVALPTLVRELDATSSELGWMVDSYALVFAGLLLTAGTLGDRFGRKGALQLGLIIFGLASVAAVFADSPEYLIATRAIMGVGAAFVMPATLSILTNVFSGEERGRAIAVWAGVAGAGGSIGPIAGGWLLEHYAWSSIFAINIPVVLLALIAGQMLLPTSRDPSKPALDFGGAALSIVGMTGLLYAIIEAPKHGWTAPETLIVFGFSIAVLAAFALWEIRQKDPMLNISFFRNPRFSAASAAIAISFFAMFGSFFILTQYLQFSRGYSALESGLRLLPMAGVMMVTAPMSARLTERFGSKIVVVVGLTFTSCGLALLSTLQGDSAYLAMIGSLAVMAFGMGLVMAPATESIMGSLPPAKAGVGSAVNDTTRELGGALGVAVLGSIFASSFGSAMADKITGLNLSPEQTHLAEDSIGSAFQVAASLGGSEAGQIVAAAQSSFADSMGPTFLVAAGFALLSALVALLWLPAREAAAQEPEAEAGVHPERAPHDVVIQGGGK